MSCQVEENNCFCFCIWRQFLLQPSIVKSLEQLFVVRLIAGGTDTKCNVAHISLYAHTQARACGCLRQNCMSCDSAIKQRVMYPLFILRLSLSLLCVLNWNKVQVTVSTQNSCPKQRSEPSDSLRLMWKQDQGHIQRSKIHAERAHKHEVSEVWAVPATCIVVAMDQYCTYCILHADIYGRRVPIAFLRNRNVAFWEADMWTGKHFEHQRWPLWSVVNNLLRQIIRDSEIGLAGRWFKTNFWLVPKMLKAASWNVNIMTRSVDRQRFKTSCLPQLGTPRFKWCTQWIPSGRIMTLISLLHRTKRAIFNWKKLFNYYPSRHILMKDRQKFNARINNYNTK